MVRELAQIETVQSGEAFENAVHQARDLFAAARGCSGMTLHRSIEHPGRYWLIVEWDAVADHEAFRSGPAFDRWRELVGPYFAGPPRVEHIEQIAA